MGNILYRPLHPSIQLALLTYWRATLASALGLPDDVIRRIGRWCSHVFKYPCNYPHDIRKRSLIFALLIVNYLIKWPLKSKSVSAASFLPVEGNIKTTEQK